MAEVAEPHFYVVISSQLIGVFSYELNRVFSSELIGAFSCELNRVFS